MIERFKEIKNIGTYKNAEHIASCGFNKITIIYGNNSQGKSTFCDILKSLSYNDPSYIENRKTIGESGNTKVEISFGNKMSANYNNGVWSTTKDLMKKQGIIIFDTEFVQKNIFTNSEIERKNKENFTDFILGEDSIKIQKQLIELKEINNKLNKENTQIANDIEKFAEISMNEFSKIKYLDDIKDIDTLCLGLNQQINNLKKDRENIEQIKLLPIPATINLQDNNIDMYNDINNILSSHYEFSPKDILKNFDEHKKKIASNNKNFDTWIRDGYALKSNEICPYCGTSLQNNELVGSYVIMFCEAFIKYTKDVDRLSNILTSTKQFDELRNNLNSNLIKIKDLTPKIYHKSITTLCQNLETLSLTLLQKIDDILNIKIELDEKVGLSITLKNNNKYEPIKNINLDSYELCLHKINELLIDYNSKIQEYNKYALEYLSNLTSKSIDENIHNLEKELLDKTKIINRNKLNEKYLQYAKNDSIIKENESVSNKLKNEIEKTQSAFIKDFFKDINIYFKRLGSQNYQIDQETSKLGIRKIFTLNLKYRDKKIDTLQFVLSDSDKRALALSIFLSKLKNDKNLNSKIIVMDDPITSFDSERMSLFINILKEFDNANQIIILTHYVDFYKKIVELMYSQTPSPALLKIQFLPNSNKIITVDRNTDNLLMDEYERALYNMYAFIDGISHTYSSNDARTLMQKYLEYKFYYEIRSKNINCLKFEEFLSTLKTYDLITNTTFTRLNQKREEYNVNSHVFDDDSEEAKRNSVIDLHNILKDI